MDGNSTDGTAEIVEKYGAIFPAIYFISAPDNGIYDAMNKGIERAKGHWIYFLGSDDSLVNEHVLESVAEKLDAGYDIIYGNTIWQPGDMMEAGEWDHRRHLNMCINHQRIFYKTKLFKKHGAFNTHYPVASDYDLNIRFFCNPAIVTRYINCNIAVYHSGGFSADKIDENFWDDFKTVMQEKFSAYLPKKEIYGRLGFYCWYNMQKGKYIKAMKLFFKIYFNTRSVHFVKHSVSQLIKSFKQ